MADGFRPRQLRHLVVGMVGRCIRNIQMSRRGLVPVRVTVVKDEDGNPCTTPESQ